MDYDRLRELQEKYEENPRRYFAPLANEYRKGGQVKRAIEICRNQLAQMPGHMSGQIVYGQSLYEAGEFDEARQVFERALGLDPENLIALRSLGDMALQAGNTADARTWYGRLLEADPKDTAVIALVSEIEASSDAAPVAISPELSFIDTDEGDQLIPVPVEKTDAPQSSPEPAAAASTAAPAEGESPSGLERHFPVEEPQSEAAPDAPIAASFSESLGMEDLGVPMGGDSAAEGLKSHIKVRENPLDWGTPAAPAPAFKGPTPPPEPLEPPAMAAAPEPESAPAPVTASASPSTAPFVNETMAQLYLQQGYKQLALQVYRQLAVSRPQDLGLRQRIAEIEAADAAEHPADVPSARKEQSVERPGERPAPRAPSIESPTPGRPSESEEAPSYGRSPVDSPPSRQPGPDRESVEAPMRDERRAEPEGIAARQQSMKEFFATLGRRRPGRASSSGAPRSGNNQMPDVPAQYGSAASTASLDAVFAGATVNPSDARAASRLAGAFSAGTGGASPSRTAPTPPMPTPRVNPRMPQAQESEEDVAKFRAWLDGLTGE